MTSSRLIHRFLFVSVLGLLLSGCYPTPGPDKTFAGAVLGAGWGAGAGAAIGNQVAHPGPGAAIGSGFGALAGALDGAALDVAEGHELEAQRRMDSLELQVSSNQRALMALQATLDNRERGLSISPAGTQIFFDQGRASLRLGSAAKLERLASSIKVNPFVGIVEVHGHTDDTGNDDLNRRLSIARARTVAAFLGQHGVPLDQVKVFAHGAQRPLATNANDGGRQLNRRVEIVLLK